MRAQPGRTLTTMPVLPPASHTKPKGANTPNLKPHRRNQQEKAQRTLPNNPENPSIRRILILTNTPSCIRPDRYGNCGAAIGRRRGHPESVPTNPGGPSHFDGLQRHMTDHQILRGRWWSPPPRLLALIPTARVAGRTALLVHHRSVALGTPLRVCRTNGHRRVVPVAVAVLRRRSARS